MIKAQLKEEVIQDIENMFIDMKEIIRCTEKDLIIHDRIDNISSKTIKDENLINMLVILKKFNFYTFKHSLEVSIISTLIGILLNMSDSNLYMLTTNALLHDIGKIFIENEILNKPSKLTPKEFKVIKKHPQVGYNYLIETDLKNNLYLGVLHHHEKYDGTGYPQKLIGTEISILGRIIAIADVYNALTSKRPYNDQLEPSKAIELILSKSGTHFDPQILNIIFKNQI